jgi:hypothetical protein
MKQKLIFIVIGCSLALLSSVRTGAAAKLGVVCFGFATLSDVVCFELDDTPSGAGAFTLTGIQATSTYVIPVYGALNIDPVQNKIRVSWTLSFPTLFDQATALLDPGTVSGPVSSRVGVNSTLTLQSFAQGQQAGEAAQAARQAPGNDTLPDMLTVLLQLQAGN